MQINASLLNGLGLKLDAAASIIADRGTGMSVIEPGPNAYVLLQSPDESRTIRQLEQDQLREDDSTVTFDNCASDNACEWCYSPESRIVCLKVTSQKQYENGSHVATLFTETLRSLCSDCTSKVYNQAMGKTIITEDIRKQIAAESMGLSWELPNITSVTRFIERDGKQCSYGDSFISHAPAPGHRTYKEYYSRLAGLDTTSSRSAGYLRRSTKNPDLLFEEELDRKHGREVEYD